MIFADLPPSPDTEASTPETPPESVTQMTALVSKHGCWTGSEDAPDGVADIIPGHAVVTWPGAEAASYGGERAVAAALEHVFEEKHADLRVHAFCR